MIFLFSGYSLLPNKKQTFSELFWQIAANGMLFPFQFRYKIQIDWVGALRIGNEFAKFHQQKNCLMFRIPRFSLSLEPLPLLLLMTVHSSVTRKSTIQSQLRITLSLVRSRRSVSYLLFKSWFKKKILNFAQIIFWNCI